MHMRKIGRKEGRWKEGGKEGQRKEKNWAGIFESSCLGYLVCCGAVHTGSLMYSTGVISKLSGESADSVVLVIEERDFSSHQ